MGKCGKGTGSFGLRNTKSHKLCRRCGKNSLHIQKKECASCGYPKATLRRFNWSKKAIRRRTQGTGRMSHLKTVKKMHQHGLLRKTAKALGKAV